MLRTPRRRWIATALALTLLGAVGYVGLGWAVWTHPDWIRKTLGADREVRLRIGYANAVGSLYPRDQDRDGIPDGVELLWHTNPKNAADHFQMQFWRDGSSGVHEPALSPKLGHDVSNSLLCRFGERLLVRGFVGVSAVDFSNDFQVRITPPPGGRLALPGNAQSADELVVPVAPDGSVAFDMDLRADIFADRNTHLQLKIANAATGEVLGTCSVYGVHTFPTVNATTERVNPQALATEGPLDTYRVSWPEIPASAKEVLVEVAIDAAGAEWHPVHIYPASVMSCVISHHPKDRRNLRSHGLLGKRLKCRVVPLRSTGLFAESPAK